jgi:hypothetical protein
MSLIARLVLTAAGVSLAMTMAACGTAGNSQTVIHSQLSGNLAIPTFSFHGQLNSVSAASASDAWAVGLSGTYPHVSTLMLHWDGQAWSRVTSPTVLDGVPRFLIGVTAVSASDAWAVGFTGALPGPAGPARSDRALLLHWDGMRWSQATGLPETAAGLSGIAMSGHDGWAVGESAIAGHPQALILRWNGARWHPVPAPAGVPGLTKVALTPAGTAWAIGAAPERGSLTTRGVLIRWNGNTWQRTSFPIAGPANSLLGIAAGPDGTAWAVGQHATAVSQLKIRAASPPLSMRWTGAAWQAVPAPGANGGFYSVTIAPGPAVWAVGGGDAGPLAMRWTGTSWAQVPAPIGDNPQATGGLADVAFSAPSDGWAVGTYWIASQGSQQNWPLIIHWNGTAWN